MIYAGLKSRRRFMMGRTASIAVIITVASVKSSTSSGRCMRTGI